MIIHGMSGYPAKVDQDGKLHVEANINVDSVTATDVTIKDAADGAKKLTINGDGSINVVQTGRSAEEKVVFNAVAITNTNFISGNTVDVSGYKEFTFVAMASLNQPVTLYFQISSDNYTVSTNQILNNGNFEEKTVTVPVGMLAIRRMIKRKDIGLDDAVIRKITVVARCTVAPTTGVLTMYLEGEKN